MNKGKSPLRLALIATMVCGMLAGSLPGQYRSLVSTADAAPAAAAVREPGFADIFERVSPAVVNISVTTKADVQALAGRPGRPDVPFGDGPLDDFFGRFFGAPMAPPRAAPARALGSGFILDSDGYVVTNNHVIDGADSIVVTLADGRELDATLVGTDPKTDLAVLKVAADEPLTSVTLGDSDSARVGEWVLAVGNPFGLGGTATFGIISAIGRDIQSGPYDDYLQIDAPINSGNSGGPVFNTSGEVIGVNTAIFSPNGGNIGIGFAIPAAQVRTITDALKSEGHVTRGWLGVQIQAIDDDLARNLGVGANSGVLVSDIVADSPAAAAQLEVGDVVQSFDGKAVDSPKTLSRLVADAGPNEKVRLGVLRDGKSVNVAVRLGEADSPAMLAASGGAGQTNPAAADKLGLALQPLTSGIREQLGLGDDVDGLVVTTVEPGSAASEKGLRRGDVILSVDGSAVHDLADFAAAVTAAGDADRGIRLLVRRGDSQRFVALGLA